MRKRIRFRPAALVLIALVIIGVALNAELFLGASHDQARKAELQREITNYQTKLRQASKLPNVETLQRELEELKKVRLSFATEEQCSELAGLLFRWARQSETEVIGCSTVWITESRGDVNYPVLACKLQLKGSPGSLARFLELIAGSSLPTIGIDALELTSGKQYWTLNLEVKLYAEPSFSEAGGQG